MIENENTVSVEGRKIEIHSLGPVSPGGTGMLSFRMNGSADLIGIEVEEGAEAIRILASRLDLDSKVFPLIEMLENIKSKEGPIRLRGTVTVLVKNNTDVAKNMTGFLYVKNEEATGVEVISASGRKIPQSSDVNHAPRRVQYKVSTDSNAVHRNLGTPAVRHVTQKVLNMVLPREGEHAVLMARGHTLGLFRFLKYRSKFHPNFPPAILKQLIVGLRREGAVSFGGNEVAIILRSDQITKLHSAVANKYNHMSNEETEIILVALQESLIRKEGESTKPIFKSLGMEDRLLPVSVQNTI